MAKYLASGEISEWTIQVMLFQWIAHYPLIKDFIFSIQNEGKRTLKRGSISNQMGLRKGVSDIFIALPKHNFHGAWIELKSKGKKPTDAQKKFLEDMSSKNYFTAVCDSFEKAKETIEWYCKINL